MRARGRAGRVGGKALGRLQRRGVGGHQRRQRTVAAPAAGAWCWIDRWGSGRGQAQAQAQHRLLRAAPARWRFSPPAVAPACPTPPPSSSAELA